jgi:hypothetical protein
MTEKAWYWVALGVLAIGLNQGVLKGRLDLASSIAARSTAFAQELSGRALRMYAMAQAEFGDRNSENFVIAPTMTHVQANLACAQATMARTQARMILRQNKLMRLQQDQLQGKVLDKLRDKKVFVAPQELPAPDKGTI